MGDVVKIDELKNIIKNLRAQNKKIVFTNGCFDILHVGHVRYLSKSAQCGDVLIVGLNSDSSVKKLKGESRPINNESDRAEVLCALKSVDYVIVFDELSPCNLLKELKPDIYTKGADYNLETLPETKCAKENNIEIKFIDLVEGKSTTKIIEKIR